MVQTTHTAIANARTQIDRRLAGGNTRDVREICAVLRRYPLRKL